MRYVAILAAVLLLGLLPSISEGRCGGGARGGRAVHRTRAVSFQQTTVRVMPMAPRAGGCSGGQCR